MAEPSISKSEWLVRCAALWLLHARIRLARWRLAP